MHIESTTRAYLRLICGFSFTKTSWCFVCWSVLARGQFAFEHRDRQGPVSLKQRYEMPVEHPFDNVHHVREDVPDEVEEGKNRKRTPSRDARFVPRVFCIYATVAFVAVALSADANRLIMSSLSRGSACSSPSTRVPWRQVTFEFSVHLTIDPVLAFVPAPVAGIVTLMPARSTNASGLHDHHML